MARSTLFELCEAFYAEGAPTRLKLRDETLSGTLESLLQRPGRSGARRGRHGGAGRHSDRSTGLGRVRVRGRTAPPAGLGHAQAQRRPNARSTARWRWPTRPGAGAVCRTTSRQGKTCSPCPPCTTSWKRSCAAWGAGFLPLPLAQPYITGGPAGGQAGAEPQPGGAHAVRLAPTRAHRVTPGARCAGGWIACRARPPAPPCSNRHLQL